MLRCQESLHRLQEPTRCWVPRSVGVGARKVCQRVSFVQRGEGVWAAPDAAVPRALPPPPPAVPVPALGGRGGVERSGHGSGPGPQDWWKTRPGTLARESRWIRGVGDAAVVPVPGERDLA